MGRPRNRTPSQQAIKDRNSRTYMRLRDRFRGQCAGVGALCHLCGQTIDYTIPAGETDAFEVDHFHPVDTHPELFEDIANFRASHKGCNGSRGSKDVKPTLGQPSETW